MHPALVLHLVTLVAGAAVLLYDASRQWFVTDEWSFILGRDIGAHPVQALFAPHNEHWSTIPVLVWRGLLSLFGLHHYVVFAVPVVLAHLALAHLLWRLLVRLPVRPWVATAVVALFVFYAAGSMNVLWAFQIGFVGSVLFGYAEVWSVAALPPGRRSYALGWIAAVLALMCSGMGLVMVAMAGFVALLRRGWRAAVLAVSLPAAVFLTWYAAIGRDGSASDSAGSARWDVLPAYLAHGVLATVGQLLGGHVAGVAAVVALLCVLVLVTRSSRQRTALAWSGLAGMVVLFLITGIGRTGQFGVAEAAASRYLYVAFAMLVPAIAVAADWFATRHRAMAVLASGVGIVVLAGNVALLQHSARYRVTYTQPYHAQLNAAAFLAMSGQPIRDPVVTDMAYAPVISPSAFRSIVARGWLTVFRPRAADLLQVQSRMQVAMTARPRTSSAMHDVVVAGAPLAASSCTTLPAGTSRIEARTGPRGGRLRLATRGRAVAHVALRRAGLTSATKPFSLGSGTGYLDIATRDVVVLASVTLHEPARVCAPAAM